MRLAVLRWPQGSLLLRLLLGGLVLAVSCPGQPAGAQHQKLVTVSCPQGANFEHYMGSETPYFVESSEVSNPFDFLPWVHAQDAAAADDIARLVNQKPFSYVTDVSQALNLLDGTAMLPDATHVRIKVRVDLVVVHCHESSRNVDLSYKVYTSQVAPPTAGTVEGQKVAEQKPQTASGLTAGSSRPFQPSNLLPQIGFDSAARLYAGGQITVPLCGYHEPPPPSQPSSVSSSPPPPANPSPGAAPKKASECTFPLQLFVEGEGSQAMESFQTTLRASHDSLGPVLHSSYLLNYNLVSTPTGAGEVRRSLASLQYSGTSRPFFKGEISARFGGLLEKGNEQVHLSVPVQPGSSMDAPVNALKLYGGLDSRVPHNVLSASFGLELGTTDVGSGVQWRKYIGYLHDDFWLNVGSHHTLDVDSRLATGAIQAAGPIPVAERFFGGNFEQLFVPDDAWQIRANPVIRAIPGNRFYQTAAGAGADRFTEANFTVAFAVWRKPLVPDEVRNDPTFMQLLDGQIVTATSIDQLHYMTTDGHYLAIVNALPGILTHLASLGDAVTAAQRAHPDHFATQFKACTSAAKMAASRASSALASSDAKRYGLVSALLKVDTQEDRLSKAIQRCDALNVLLKTGPADTQGPLATPLGLLETDQGNIESEYTGINKQAAADKAAADMAFVKRTLKTLFNEVNLASISPVAVFDAARIGPRSAAVDGVRYGPGGGLRLDLASAVNFTVGYARNVKAGPGEGSGAIFFSIGLKDLFH